jgi:hypothetical protein
MNEYHISLTYDDEARVWIAESEDIPGLILESGSLDVLMERVRYAVPELLKLSGDTADIFLSFKAERRAGVYA